MAERRGQTFDAPQALFQACAQARVRRVIQLSALGANEHARSRYHLSKRAADDALLALPLEAVVLQQGAGAVQPVHIDDLSALVVRLIWLDRRPPATCSPGSSGLR